MDKNPNSDRVTTGNPARRGKKTFASNSEYQKYLAIQKGFASLHQYREHLAKQRQQKAENRGLSAVIRRKLIEAGRIQSWLAEQIGCTRQTVSLYAHGKIRPKDPAVLERIHSVLEVR